jgi:hypothetical protein
MLTSSPDIRSVSSSAASLTNLLSYTGQSSIAFGDFDTLDDSVSQFYVNGPSTTVILKLFRNV